MIGAREFRVRNKIGRFTGVEQSEVLSILGMSEECAAEWIAAGRTRWRPGQSDQISAVELVDLTLTHLLSVEGWAPEESRSVVGAAIAIVFYNAFVFADHSLEVTGLPDDVDRFRTSFEESTDLANELTGGPHRYSGLCRVDDSPAFRLARHIPANDVKDQFTPQGGVCFRDVACKVVAGLGRPLLSVELVNHAPRSHATGKWLSSARSAECSEMETSVGV